ncbi:MAG: hypothetical protein GXO11_00535 [Epsilonproteobacteria bacterium]|nr:hypothetical protein [Campylobacterota bacterium]
MYIKTFVVFVSLLFFSACGGTTPASASNNEQNWIISPPADTPFSFYSVGEGKTQQEAKNDALAKISAKISVSVSSSFNSSVTANRIGDDEEVLSQIKKEVATKSKQIEYSNVKVLKSTKKDGKYVVLVEVSRDDLARNYKNKLAKIDQKLQTQWEFFQKASPFEKLKLAAKIEKLLAQTDTIFPILHIIDENFDDSAYTKRYAHYTKEIQKAKNELYVKIEADENSQSLVSLLKEYLSNEGVKFSNTHYNVVLKITTKAKKRRYRSTNEKFANLVFALRKTTIAAYDNNGNLISSVVYKTKEGSNQGFEDAIAKTAKYEKKIKQLGVINFITGNK